MHRPTLSRRVDRWQGGDRVRARAPRQGHRLDARARSRRLGAGRPRAGQLRHALRAGLGTRPHARTLPDYDVSLAPTPHPLATLAGAVLSVLGAAGSIDATIVLAFVFLGALGWVTYRLGEAWINRAAGALAAAIVLTRRPVLDFGARAYVDVPYLALVLGALLVETRRPRAGAPVLVLLGVAGLIRPEAWLFSAAYLVWLWIGGVRDPRLWALAAAAPLLWALGDLIVTGDPLHSLTGTRDTAQRLDRITGLAEVPGTVPRRLGEILREPVLFGAAGGGVLALAFLRTRVAARRRRRRRRPRGLLRAGGRRPADPRALPARSRHHPRALLRGGRLRLGGAPARAPVAAAVGVVRGADADRPGRLHPAPRSTASATCATRCASRTTSRTTCTRSRRASPARRSRCPTTARCRCWRCGSTSRPSGSRSPRSTGRAAAPTSCRSSARVARQYILDPRDVDPRIPPPPAGFLPVGANASWRAFARCG